MIAREDGRLILGGRLTMETVPGLYEAGLSHLSGGELLVDFSRVESVDSSAISMLLGWSRVAREQNCALRVTGLPEGLVSLAGLYGVADMLPVQAG